MKMRVLLVPLLIFVLIIGNVDSQINSWLDPVSNTLERFYKGFLKTFELEDQEITPKTKNISIASKNELLSKYHNNNVFQDKKRYSQHRNKVERQFVALGVGLGGAVIPALAAGAAASAVINSDPDNIREPLTEFIATTSYDILNPLASALGFPLYNPYAAKTTDPCEGIGCALSNEKCVNGVCVCGTTGTCTASTSSPWCDGTSCTVLCTFKAGTDAQGGTEAQIGTGYTSALACAYDVWKTYPDATAATFGVIGQSDAGKCWAEWGTKTESSDVKYTFCYLP